MFSKQQVNAYKPPCIQENEEETEREEEINIKGDLRRKIKKNLFEYVDKIKDF
jgi:hypothetical protein